MRYRCEKTYHTAYHYYGGRGITVCERWRGRGCFANFLADMGERPGPNWDLHRKDTDGPYSPENCVWMESSAHHKLHVPRGFGDGGPRTPPVRLPRTDDLEEIKRLRAEGLTLREIAERVGTSAGRVWRVLKTGSGRRVPKQR